MSPSDLPVSSPVEAFWTASPNRLDDFQSSKSLPVECDVLIIGSGYAGVATAYHMFASTAGSPSRPQTVMLDARKLTSGATGRNGGHLKPDTYMGVTKLASVYGKQQAAEVQRYETDQVYQVKQLVEKEGLDCDFHLTRACDAIMDPAVAEHKAREYHQLVKDGVVDMRDVTYVPKKDAERISGVKGAQCCFTFTAGHVWPRKMMHQILEKLIQQGLQMHANTPVLELSKTRDARGHWTVTTPRGAIKAKKVVACTNAYTSSVLPQYKSKIIPVRGVCCRITSPKGGKTPHLPCTYSLRFDPIQYDYLVPRADGSIVVGGARAAFWHNKDSWWHNKNDSEQVKDTAEYFDNYMQGHFHGWEDSGAKLDQIWTGSMFDSIPFTCGGQNHAWDHH
jgi:glycine/D-amino acid oxidase-like deaminating enzyme